MGLAHCYPLFSIGCTSCVLWETFHIQKKQAQVAGAVLLADIGVARILLLKFSEGVLPLVTRNISCNEAGLGSILPGPTKQEHEMFPNFPQTAGNEGMEKKMETTIMGYTGTTIRIWNLQP